MYRRKTSIKIDLEHLIYRHFWTSTIKTCIFNGKFFAGLSNLLFTCPEDYLQSNVSERKSWKLKDFWINFEVFGKMAENIFQGCQNSKRCTGKNLLKNVFKREKFIFFSILSGILLWVKKLDRRAEPANYVSVENFWGNFLRKPIKSFTPLWFLIQKIRSRKFYL